MNIFFSKNHLERLQSGYKNHIFAQETKFKKEYVYEKI